MEGEDVYFRLSAGASKVPAELQELVNSRGESRTLSSWAALAPDAFARFFEFLDPHFSPETGSLPVKERMLIAVVVSAENRCVGCLLVNTRRLAQFLDDAETARRISINYRTVPLSKRERAIADTAIQMTGVPWSVEQDGLDGLRAHGLSEREILEVVELAAVMNMTNRISSALGSRPDPEFFDEPQP